MSVTYLIRQFSLCLKPNNVVNAVFTTYYEPYHVLCVIQITQTHLVRKCPLVCSFNNVCGGGGGREDACVRAFCFAVVVFCCFLCVFFFSFSYKDLQLRTSSKISKCF